MGKITDAAVAVFVIIVGFFVLDRLGITWPAFWATVHHFFYGSSAGTNTTAGTIFGISAAARKQKIMNRMTDVKRSMLLKFIRKTEKEARERD